METDKKIKKKIDFFYIIRSALGVKFREGGNIYVAGRRKIRNFTG